ncbi:MAG: alpha/beta fold hydrolase [Mycobacteriaceae bacterium]
MRKTAQQFVDQHMASSQDFLVEGVRSSVLDNGCATGRRVPVIFMHGVPASSFLYRKVVANLAEHNVRGLAFDLPGTGLADRPSDFDYTWTGLGDFSAKAVDALGIDDYHLVVHDIGGPVGFELTQHHQSRVKSLTILNTMVSVETFRKPWAMAPFAVPVLGNLWLGGTPMWAFVRIMRTIGVFQQKHVSNAELAAHLLLLKRTDGGQAFLKIMRNFETTHTKQELYCNIVADPTRPRQVLWGVHDQALKVGIHGAEIARIAGTSLVELPGRHFIQEDNATAIATAVAAFTQAKPLVSLPDAKPQFLQ